MLLTIHNLPSSYRYADIKNILNEKCGLTDIILDNLVSEGKGKKVTVGLANDDDGALVVRKINGLILNGNQLYIEDRRRKTGERDQPYRASASLIQEARSSEPTLGSNPMGGMPVAPNVPVMWNYNMAVPAQYMVPVPVEQNLAYAGYGGAPQAAHYVEPVVPSETERGHSRFQGEGYPPGIGPREQEPVAWGRSGREQGSDNYRHPDRKRHHSPERPAVPKKRGSRWNEKEAATRREPSPPRQQWPQDMNQGPRPPFHKSEQFTRDRDQNQYQLREPKPDYRAPEPQWENRWDAPKPRVERDRDWGNTNNQNWEPETDKVWENQPNQNWRDQPMQGNNEPVSRWEEEYSRVPERDGPEWFNRQPEQQMDQYRGDQFYDRGPVAHESRPRQRDTDWNDRRPQNDRDGPRRPHIGSDTPRHPQNDRDVPRHPQNVRDAPRRPNERDVPRRPQDDRDVPRRLQNDRNAPRHFQNDREPHRRPRDDRDTPRRPQNDMESTRKWSREPVGPGAGRSVSSSNRNSRRDQPPRRDRSRSNNAPQGRDYREDRRNPPQDLPGGARENPDYWRQVANDYPEPKKTEYRREQNQGYMPDMQKKPAMRDERKYPYPPREDRRFPTQKSVGPLIDLAKKPQTITTLINRDSCIRGQATATIAKLMLGIKGKPQFNSMLNGFIFKQLKLCIKARIDVLLGEELSSDMDEIIKRYRVKFPVSGDKVLLQQIREKSTKEYEVMQEQRKMNELNPVKKEEGTATQNNSRNAAVADEAKPLEVKPIDAAKTNAAGVVAAPKVTNNATVVVPAPKVIPGPKLSKAKKNKPLTDKQVIKHMKEHRKWEYDQDDLYNLDAVSKKALEDEITILDKFFTEECANPADPQEELICKRIMSDSLNEFNKAIGLYITKRFLKIQTGLAIRLFAMGKLPKKEAIKQYLKKYRVEALKKSVKGNMYMINLSRFQDFDTLCRIENAVIDGTPVTFKAMHLTGPPLKISRNQILKMRQQQIQGQIEDVNMDDFEETTDYTEDVAGDTGGEANTETYLERVDTGDFTEDVITGEFTEDVTGEFTEDVTGEFTEDVSGEFTDDVTGDFTKEVTEHVTGNCTENVNTEHFSEQVTDTYTEDVNNEDFTDDVNDVNFSTDNNAEDGVDTENDNYDVIEDVNIDNIDEDDLEDF